MPIAATERRQFGLIKESVRGTAETTPTKWYPISKDSILNPAIAYLEDQQLRGVPDQFPATPGVNSYDGKIKMDLDAQACAELFYSLLGTLTTTELTSVTIGASNNKLDFNIGAGELTATIASATYAVGTAHSQAGTLCKAIYDAIVAAEAVGTYTVSFSNTTKKFTITRSAGTFQIMWKTGTNGSDDATPTSIGPTLGYSAAADDTGALTYTSDTALAGQAFSHAITRNTSTQRIGYTFFLDHGESIIKKYSLSTVKKMSINGPVDNLIEIDTDILATSEAAGAIGTPSYPTPHYLTFEGVTVKIDTVEATDIKSWKLDIDNGAMPFRVLNQSRNPSDILVKGKLKVNGSMVVYFTDETQRNKFIAGTTVALQFLVEGATIAGSNKYTVDISMPKCLYKAYPFGEDDGLLAANVTFEAYYDTVTSKSISVTVINSEASY